MSVLVVRDNQTTFDQEMTHDDALEEETRGFELG